MREEKIKRIIQFLKDNGVTVVSIAKATGVNRSFIHQWLDNKNTKPINEESLRALEQYIEMLRSNLKL